MLRMRHLYILAIFTFPLAGISAGSLTCTEPGAFEQAVDAGEIRVLRLDTGSGVLRLRGSDEIDEIRVSGQACALDPEMLADFKLVLEPVDGVLTLTDRMPDGANHPEASFAKLHMALNVPRRLAIEVTTQREPVHINNIASLKIDKERGELDIENVDGDVEVTSRFGDLTIRNVGGNVTLSRDRGETIIEGVRGNVVVERSLRGNTLFRDIGGDLHISKERGNIAAVNVAGDLVVRDRQEGRLTYDNIGGRVDATEPTGIPAEVLAREDEDDDNGKGPPHLRGDN